MLTASRCLNMGQRASEQYFRPLDNGFGRGYEVREVGWALPRE